MIAPSEPPQTKVDNIYRSIPKVELLVSDDFKINSAEAVRKACGLVYPNYPSLDNRLSIETDGISKLEEEGFPHANFRRGVNQSAPLGTNSSFNHPNYRNGLEKGKAIQDDGEKDFHDTSFPETFDPRGYKRDSRGVPLHPYYDVMLKAGAVVGPGFYWNYGPNRAADPVVFKKSESGKLQVLIIERNDTGSKALPGGMVDKDEPDISAATRELLEEAGTDLKDVEHEIVHQGPVGDLRQTLNAWPETTVAVLYPDELTANNMKLKAGDDARKALWADVTEENVSSLFASHPDFVRVAVLAWQKRNNLVVAKDGTIGNRS